MSCHKPFFTADLLDGRNVLRDLKSSKIRAVFTAHREITYQYVLAAHLDPEILICLLARLKVCNDALHDMHACGRLAVCHFAAYDGFSARKHALSALREILNGIVAAHERDVYRQRVEQFL